ncbi:hypothetical protein M885DRAFT_522324 [Pelagophyceae sp. CCMP2097]|nr:hypothetical protein M885DRAFT_522324 [Pelagophyceae sp. CCMP2097]
MSTVAITGALSYTGRYIASTVLNGGGKVVSLSRRSVPIAASPLTPSQISTISSDRKTPDYGDENSLAKSLEGCDVLYSTYWVRFIKEGVDVHTVAAENCGRLFRAAKLAGVRKIVFTSHTQVANAPKGRFAYLDGKRRAEEFLADSGVDYGIARPCGIFGETPEESILLNNAAWLIRRAPLFLVYGDGSHKFQPVHVRDLADLMLDLGASKENAQDVDACGPDTPTALELFSKIRDVTKSYALVAPAGPLLSTNAITQLTRPLNWFTGDVLLDDDELDFLASGLTVAENPTDARIAPRKSLFTWLEQNGDTLGKSYVSSMERYYTLKT